MTTRAARRLDLLSLGGSAALAISAFLPWLRLGDIGLRGVPDPAGFFVLGVGTLGVLLAVVSLLTTRQTGQVQVLVGFAGLTTLGVVWLTGPATIAARALARAEAVSLVDNVALQPPPAVGIGVGLLLGLSAALIVAAAGVASVWSSDSR
jgi:hypothetical protein